MRGGDTGNETRRRDNPVIGAQYGGTQPANGAQTMLFQMSTWHNASAFAMFIHGSRRWTREQRHKRIRQRIDPEPVECTRQHKTRNDQQDTAAFTTRTH